MFTLFCVRCQQEFEPQIPEQIKYRKCLRCLKNKKILKLKYSRELTDEILNKVKSFN